MAVSVSRRCSWKVSKARPDLVLPTASFGRGRRGRPAANKIEPGGQEDEIDQSVKSGGERKRRRRRRTRSSSNGGGGRDRLRRAKHAAALRR
jgi:hypothetical protein